MPDNFKYVQAQSTQLYGAGASIGDTSVRIASLIDLLGSNLAMTDFGSKGYGTLEPGTSSQEEPISWTGVTQNGDGTATLTGVSNVLGKAPYTEVSGLKITHAGGTTFVISNTAAFYNSLTSKNDDETIMGIYTFTAPNYPQIDTPATLPSADGQFATKKYVDDSVVAGAPKATNSVYGISKLSTAAVSGTQPIVVGDNDTRVPTQDENDALVGTSGTPSSSNKYVTNADTIGTGSVVRDSVTTAISNKIKFGGTGADGALAITTGTTTIDLTGLQVFVKNYTSISITSTGALAFSNPAAGGTIIILKSQGNVDITSSANPVINLKNTGAGAATSGISLPLYSSDNGTSQSGQPGGLAGVGRGFIKTIYGKAFSLSVGGGGGNGSVAGGLGGGSLMIECAGAYNFTTGVIDASGTIGTAGSGNQAGGGGGAGGSVVVIYNTLTANSGTYTLTGANGGAGAGSPTVGGGGGGANRVSGTAGQPYNSSSGLTAASDDGAGGSAGANAGGGGGSAGGYKLITQNTEFA